MREIYEKLRQTEKGKDRYEVEAEMKIAKIGIEKKKKKNDIGK